ncbi:MAG: electron transfer flavoprotein NAD/FAD-binding domain and adenine nucleotide-binding [Pseudomonadota bacterium]|jgi:electron transfer flavoprotein alpha subunit
MSNVIVFLQQTDGVIPKATLVAITAARELQKVWSKGELIGVCLGDKAKAAAEAALSYGFKEVFFSEAPELGKYLAVPYAAAVVEAFNVSGADTIVAAATTTGKDLLPRVAALIDAGQASDISAINPDGSLRRPMYAGNAFADVDMTTPKRVVTVRATAFAPAEPLGGGGGVKELTFTFDRAAAGEVIGYSISGGDRPELGDAAIVVSGGRALQSKENFEQYMFPLADAFGAAVGASRAAVDSGYAPNDWQVGQTGKVVAPSLYVAVGISGAIQHLAGMKDSKTIVAVNKDPEAPIFEVADYGLVADLYQAVPALTEAVKKAKAG